ncbi:MAG: HicB family protein [Methylobacter sp.]|nr:MAG: HicB family protein [Methylobacter sp.]
MGFIMPLKKHFPIVIEQDADGFYIVSCPLFQACRSYGKTIDDALSNIQEAIGLCLEEQDDQQNGPANIFIYVRDIELAV